MKQSLILQSEGQAEATIKVAEAKAQEIKLVNESLQKHFKHEAQDYKKLETAQEALKSGSKYVLDSEKDLTTVISEVAGVVPMRKK